MTISINPAMMRHRATFQKKVREQDSNGLEKTTWVDVTRVRISFVALSGKERIVSAQTMASHIARVSIYKNTLIDESMRMLFDGRKYNIKDILPDPTNAIYWTLLVERYD